MEPPEGTTQNLLMLHIPGLDDNGKPAVALEVALTE
jgi:hypothetical protein